MPVYFVGASSGPGLKLYREFRTDTRIDGPISSTISAMTRLTPLDPEYFNPWRSASWVKVSDEAATLTVDLSADAFRNTNVGSELDSDRAAFDDRRAERVDPGHGLLSREGQRHEQGSQDDLDERDAHVVSVRGAASWGATSRCRRRLSRSGHALVACRTRSS